MSNGKITIVIAGENKLLDESIKRSTNSMNKFVKEATTLAEHIKKPFKETKNSIDQVSEKINKNTKEIDKNTDSIKRNQNANKNNKQNNTNSPFLNNKNNILNSAGKGKSILPMLASALPMGLAVGSVAGIAALGGAFINSTLKVGGDFQTAISKLQSTMGVTDKKDTNFLKLKDASLNMGGTLFSPTEVAEGLNYMALAGYDAKKSLEVLPNILNLATAGGMDLARTSDLVTDALTSIGLTDSKQYVDVITKTSQKSNTNIEQLSEALTALGGNARGINGGLFETVTLLGLIADNGKKGTEGATHLRNIMQSVGDQTKDGKALIEAWGLKLKDTAGGLRPVYEIFKDISKATSGMGSFDKDQALGVLFNRYDLAPIKAIMNTSKERYEELLTEALNSSGSAEQTAQIMRDNLQGSVKGLSVAFKNVQTSIFENQEENIAGLTKFLNWTADEMQKATKGNEISFFDNTPVIGGNYIKKDAAKLLLKENRIKDVLGDANNLKDKNAFKFYNDVSTSYSQVGTIRNPGFLKPIKDSKLTKNQKTARDYFVDSTAEQEFSTTASLISSSKKKTEYEKMYADEMEKGINELTKSIYKIKNSMNNLSETVNQTIVPFNLNGGFLKSNNSILYEKQEEYKRLTNYSSRSSVGEKSPKEFTVNVNNGTYTNEAGKRDTGNYLSNILRDHAVFGK